MQEHLLSHFSMAGHDVVLNDVSIKFIDKTDPSDPLPREDYQRQKLKTMVLYGLNIEDTVWAVFLCLHGDVVVLHGNVSGVCFVGLYCRQCCYFYIITVAVNVIVIIIITCISNIIAIIIIILTILFCFTLISMLSLLLVYYQSLLQKLNLVRFVP